MRVGNPFRTIGFRIELGKLIAFSVVLLYFISVYPKGIFLYILLGIIFLIGIFSFVFYSMVDLNEKKKYTREQIRYLRLMIIIFLSLSLISFLIALYDKYLGLVSKNLGYYFPELLIITFVCLVLSLSTYSALRETGNCLFKKKNK